MAKMVKIALIAVYKFYNTSIAAKGACRTTCKIQNGRYLAPKWLTESGKVLIPRFLGLLSNLR